MPRTKTPAAPSFSHGAGQAAVSAAPELVWRSEAETMLPEQFFRSGRESGAVWTGERRLLLAVLEEAINAFLKYRGAQSRRARRLFAETAAWFAARDHGWLYSFENICQYLALDADYVRGGLQRLDGVRVRGRRTAVPSRERTSRYAANPRLARAA